MSERPCLMVATPCCGGAIAHACGVGGKTHHGRSLIAAPAQAGAQEQPHVAGPGSPLSRRAVRGNVDEARRASFRCIAPSSIVMPGLVPRLSGSGFSSIGGPFERR